MGAPDGTSVVAKIGFAVGATVGLDTDVLVGDKLGVSVEGGTVGSAKSSAVNIRVGANDFSVGLAVGFFVGGIGSSPTPTAYQALWML